MVGSGAGGSPAGGAAAGGTAAGGAAPGSSSRLFIAVEVPGTVREVVAEAVAPLRERAPRLRWVAPDRYHLTLVFLGQVADSLRPGIVGAMRGAAAGAGAFPLQLDGRLGMFGRRVLWAGLGQSEPLAAVADRLVAGLGDLVAPEEAGRDFRAHLTLARAGRGSIERSLLDGARVEPVGWDVDRIVLLRSANGYSVVEAVALGTDA